jgi:hypothetical protein
VDADRAHEGAKAELFLGHVRYFAPLHVTRKVPPDKKT